MTSFLGDLSWQKNLIKNFDLVVFKVKRPKRHFLGPRNAALVLRLCRSQMLKTLISNVSRSHRPKRVGKMSRIDLFRIKSDLNAKLDSSFFMQIS